MAGRRRGCTELYCSSLISVFGGYDICLPGMFVGGDFREWFAKPFFQYYCLKCGGVISQWVALILVRKRKRMLGDKDVGYL